MVVVVETVDVEALVVVVEDGATGVEVLVVVGRTAAAAIVLVNVVSVGAVPGTDVHVS